MKNTLKSLALSVILCSSLLATSEHDDAGIARLKGYFTSEEIPEYKNIKAEIEQNFAKIKVTVLSFIEHYKNVDLDVYASSFMNNNNLSEADRAACFQAFYNRSQRQDVTIQDMALIQLVAHPCCSLEAAQSIIARLGNYGLELLVTDIFSGKQKGYTPLTFENCPSALKSLITRSALIAMQEHPFIAFPIASAGMKLIRTMVLETAKKVSSQQTCLYYPEVDVNRFPYNTAPYLADLMLTSGLDELKRINQIELSKEEQESILKNFVSFWSSIFNGLEINYNTTSSKEEITGRFAYIGRFAEQFVAPAHSE